MFHPAWYIEVFHQGNVIRLNYPTLFNLLTGLFDPVTQPPPRGLVFARKNRVLFCCIRFVARIGPAYLRVHAPGNRDIDQIIDTQRQPGPNSLELILQGPGNRKGVDVLETLGIPAPNHALFALFLRAPAQILRDRIAEALEGQGNMIDRLAVPRGEQSLFGVHVVHTIDKENL